MYSIRRVTLIGMSVADIVELGSRTPKFCVDLARIGYTTSSSDLIIVRCTMQVLANAFV